MSDFKNDTAGKIYEIKLEGILDESWADWLEGFNFSHRSDGTTLLTGRIVDQAALHGLLKRIRDLGIPLLSVNQISAGQDMISNEKNERENENE